MIQQQIDNQSIINADVSSANDDDDDECVGANA